MLRVIHNKQKKFNTNSKPLLEMIYGEQTDVIVLYVEMKISCLVSWLTITKIVSNLENNRSFLMKSIKMEFHSHLEIESCLRDLWGL